MGKIIKNNIYIYLTLIVILIGLVVAPLVLLKDEEFLGTDSIVQGIITKSNPGYKPWFKPVFEPQSSEVESLFFALQASIGTGIICYGFGYWRGLKKREKEM